MSEEEERTVGLSKEDRVERRLTYLFLSLPYFARLKIVVELSLVFNHDEGLTAAQSWRNWRAKAEEFHMMPALSALVARASVFRWFEDAMCNLTPGEELAKELTRIQSTAEWREWKESGIR